MISKQQINAFPRSSKTIPIPKSHIPRTRSEVQLGEEHAIAEWRDHCMFQRLVNGIWEKRCQNSKVYVRNLPPTLDQCDFAVQNDLSRDIRSQRVIDSIICSRNEDLSNYGHDRVPLGTTSAAIYENSLRAATEELQCSYEGILAQATNPAYADLGVYGDHRDPHQQVFPPARCPSPYPTCTFSLQNNAYVHPPAQYPAPKHEEEVYDEGVFNLEL